MSEEIDQRAQKDVVPTGTRTPPRQMEEHAGDVSRAGGQATADSQPGTEESPAACAPKRDLNSLQQFSELVDTCGSRVFGYCVRLLGDRHLAADVHQTVFEEAFRDLHLMRGNPRAWLFGIATHKCFDAIRARTRSRCYTISDEDEKILAARDSAPDAEELLSARATRSALEDCIQKLPISARAALLMRLQENLTFDEMSTITRTNATTLQARIARALPMLRKCMERKGVQR